MEKVDDHSAKLETSVEQMSSRSKRKRHHRRRRRRRRSATDMSSSREHLADAGTKTYEKGRLARRKESVVKRESASMVGYKGESTNETNEKSRIVRLKRQEKETLGRLFGRRAVADELDDIQTAGQRIEHHNKNNENYSGQTTNQSLAQKSSATAKDLAESSQLQSANVLVHKADQSRDESETNNEPFTNLISITVCLPIVSCLMLAALFFCIWRYCRKLASRKKSEKKKSKISKIKSQAKNSLKGIKIISGSGNCQENGNHSKRNDLAAFDKRQLTVNMETNEMSSDDQSSSSGSATFNPNSNSNGKQKTKPFDRFKLMKTTNSADVPTKGAPKSKGSIKYGLSYDFDSCLLYVTIYEARDLPAMDLCGTSDPYVKISLAQKSSSPTSGCLGGASGDQQPAASASFKTKIHKRTLRPVFNETFQFRIAYPELMGRTLLLSVFDYDRLSKHDEIGQVSVELSGWDFAQSMEGKWSQLERINQQAADVGQLGDICLSLRYVPTAGKLTVVVLEARKLKKMDLAGLSDPYVKLALLDEHGKRLKKKKTSIKKCTLNPHYNESFSFEIPFEQVQKVQLHVTVIDYDRIGTSEPIGRIILGCEKKSGDTELRHWMDMLASPRRPIAQWHSLKELTRELCSESAVNRLSQDNAAKLIPGDH